MKDSQQNDRYEWTDGKYIKANNERFSTTAFAEVVTDLSISRRIMKDSQQPCVRGICGCKYIKANNERFSTAFRLRGLSHKYIKANNERFSTGLARCRALL